MSDIANHRNLIQKLFESDDDDINDIRSMKKRVRNRKRLNDIVKRIQAREANPPKLERGYIVTNLYHEIERSMKDADGELIYIEVEIEISGHYYKGSRGGRYEPPEPSTFEDLNIISVTIPQLNPEGGPLTLTEKVKIEQWFESEDGRDAAIEALFKERGYRY